MELTFIKKGLVYEAEFEVTSDFNLHLERSEDGVLGIYQRGTSSGKYAVVKEFGSSKKYTRVVDYDFASLIYPKYIKVVCGTEPTMAVVTMAQ